MKHIKDKTKCVELWGYKVYEDGSIVGILNKKLTQYKGSRYIKAKIEDKFINIPILRFVYYAFNQDTFDINDLSYIILPKDMNENNTALSNLVLERRSNIIWGENNINSKLTDEQVKDIIKKYKNGNKKSDGVYNPYKKVSYRSLAEEYGVSHSLISGIITGRFRNKDNYKLKGGSK